MPLRCPSPVQFRIADSGAFGAITTLCSGYSRCHFPDAFRLRTTGIDCCAWMNFSPGGGRSAELMTSKVVNSSPSSKLKANGSPVDETNCTAMETQPPAQDASGFATPLTVPPMNRSVTGVVTGPELWLVPSTNTVTFASESGWAVTRLGSNLTKKALPNWSVPSYVSVPMLRRLVLAAAAETIRSKLRRQIIVFLAVATRWIQRIFSLSREEKASQPLNNEGASCIKIRT